MQGLRDRPRRPDEVPDQGPPRRVRGRAAEDHRRSGRLGLRDVPGAGAVHASDRVSGGVFPYLLKVRTADLAEVRRYRGDRRLDIEIEEVGAPTATVQCRIVEDAFYIWHALEGTEVERSPIEDAHLFAGPRI